MTEILGTERTPIQRARRTELENVLKWAPTMTHQGSTPVAVVSCAMCHCYVGKYPAASMPDGEIVICAECREETGLGNAHLLRAEIESELKKREQTTMIDQTMLDHAGRSILDTIANVSGAGVLTLDTADAPTYTLAAPNNSAPKQFETVLLAASDVLRKAGFNVVNRDSVMRGARSYVRSLSIRAYCVRPDCSNSIARMNEGTTCMCDACRAYLCDRSTVDTLPCIVDGCTGTATDGTAICGNVDRHLSLLLTEEESAAPHCGHCGRDMSSVAWANPGGVNVCHTCSHVYGIADCKPGACDYSPKFQPIIGRTYAVSYGGTITFTGLETGVYGTEEWSAIIDDRPTHVGAGYINAWLDICPDCEYSVNPVGDCYNCGGSSVWRITSPELLAALGINRFRVAPESHMPCDADGFYGCDQRADYIICNRAGDYLAAMCDMHATDIYYMDITRAFPVIVGTVFVGAPGEIVGALFPENSNPHAVCCPTVSVRVDGKASVARCTCGQPGAYVNVFATGLGTARIEVRCIVCSWLETDCK